MAKHEQSAQEKALRNYFKTKSKRSYHFIWVLLLAGILFFLSTQTPIRDEQTGFLLSSIVAALIGIYLFFKSRRSSISDRQVDQWLQAGINKLAAESRQKLGLSERDIIGEPLIVKGPILWETFGIDKNDLVWKVGDDETVRFGIYGVTIIQLTERHLGAFSCDYNFLKDVALNSATEEFHYQDVVSVSTKEQDSSYTLPTGAKLTRAQMFRLTVASGDAVEVAIGASKIGEITGSERIPETGAEKAVSVIRTMLREKKA